MSDLKDALSGYVEEQTPTTPPSFDGVEVRARHRARRQMATIAAVPLTMVAIMVGTQLTSEPTAGTPVAQAPSTSRTSNPTSNPTSNLEPNAVPNPVPNPVPKPPANPGSGQRSRTQTALLCVEQYDLATLRQRAFAFDGTVSRISATPRTLIDPKGELDPLDGYYSVTFLVHEWFRAGDQATFTLHMMSTPVPGRLGSPEGTSFDVGTRLLVSGESLFGDRPLQAPIAWECGFTRDYDPSTASAWRQTLGKR